MNLKTAFAYLVTGAVLFGAWAHQVIGSLVTFNVFTIGVDFIIAMAVWLIGLGYFLTGLLWFAGQGLSWLEKLLRKLHRSERRR